MTQGHSWAGLALSLAALGIFGLHGTARAQEETKTAHELRAAYDKDLKGKTIAFLPIATGVPLMDEWGRRHQDRGGVRASHEVHRARSRRQSRRRCSRR